MDDARLATALGRGADGALSVVFDQYGPQLYDYCLSFLADTDAAADALHEAMLVAVAWAPDLTERGDLAPWLHAITRNECLRKLRRGGRPYNVGISGDRPRPALASRGRTDPVLREVTDLVNRYRFGPPQVSAVLGISPRRAKSLCTRSAAVLSRDRRTGSAIGRQARPGLPPGLRERVLTSAASADRVAYRGELAKPRLRNGFPAPLEHTKVVERRRSTVLKVAAAGLVLGGLVVAIAVPALSHRSVLGLVRVNGPADEASDGAGGDRSPDPDQSVPGWEPSGGSDAGGGAGRTGQITGLDGKCMDVRSSSDLSGTPVDLFPCNATDAQVWTVLADGTLRAFGKCLGVTSPAAGSQAQLVPCTGERTQRWTAQLDGALVHAQSGRCLQVPSATAENFTVLTLGECTSQPNQIWRLPV